MLLIHDGTIVTADGSVQADALIDGEKIAAIGQSIAVGANVQRISAAGCLVLPGVVDPHVHFRLTSGRFTTRDDFTTGTIAAASGGVTTFIDFAAQRKGQSLLDTIAERRAEADGQVAIDYSLHLNPTDLGGNQLDELPALVESGVTSAKIYTTYKQAGFYLDDWSWSRLLERAGQVGILVLVHAENDDLLEGQKQSFLAQGLRSFRYHSLARPLLAEEEAVQRGLFLARRAGAPIYFVHCSSPASVELIDRANREGQVAIAETCPHFLAIREDVYAGPHPERYIMTPTVRGREQSDGLWSHIKQGHVKVVGSDHCGYSLDQRVGIDDFTRVSPGIPGIETLLPVMYSEGVAAGRIDVSHLVRLLSTNPARVYGLYPRKGTIQVGSDADLVIFDPNVTRVLRDDDVVSRACYSPYAGMTITGRVRTTVSRGQIIFDGAFVGRSDHGRFLRCTPFDPGVFARL